MSDLVMRLCTDIEQGKAMNPVDLQAFINEVAKHGLPVESITQWLKAVHSHGISVPETVALTTGMMNSGAVLDWDQKRPIADKHSTGGVGDKMSLMLAPALAACGAEVPMLAGRGLGHTGGTIDKLEAIPGFNCALSPQQMQSIVDDIGCCIAAQNAAIAPADGLLYAIRDVTNTVDSIPLITASIVSKKAAEGLKALVLDVKCGNAAFMKTEDQATALAHSMVKTAQGLGVKTLAQITEMNEPIGTHVGNTLEVVESIQVLNGGGPQDTINLVAMQGGALLWLLGICEDEATGRVRIIESLSNGSAAEKFQAMCMAQGTSKETAISIMSDPWSVLEKADHVTTIQATSNGWIDTVDSMDLAEIARAHGAGRFAMEDEIDVAVGFILHAAKGDKIESGQPWIEFHHNQPVSDQEMDALLHAVTISNQPVWPVERLIQVVQ